MSSHLPNDFLFSSSGYLDEVFRELEWIGYLKRLLLIVLMLCGVVLYYVPKSRSPVRRACCAFVDHIAYGLKFAINATEIESAHGVVKETEQGDRDNTPRIQELYRKICWTDTMDRERTHVGERNVYDDQDVSIRSKREERKTRTKRNADKKHERCGRCNHHYHRQRHRNANMKDATPRFCASIKSAVDGAQQMATIDEEREKDDSLKPRVSSSETRIAEHIGADIVMKSADLRDEEKPRRKDKVMEPLPCAKADTSVIPASKSENTENKSTRETADRFRRDYTGNCATTTRASDCLGSVNSCRADETVARRALKLRKENRRFLDDIESMIDNCYDVEQPITAGQTKPVLSRAVNWFFGGCPEASRRLGE